MDTYARLVAPHLGRHLGGTVVVKNVPMGGGTYALNSVYNIKKPDGLTIATGDTGSLILGQLFKDKAVKYDYKKFNWLGRISWGKRVILVGKESSFQSFKDLMKQKVIKIATNIFQASPAMTWTLLAHALDLAPSRLKVITGYGGGKNIVMSAVQGESDSVGFTEDSAAKFAKGGLVRTVLTVDKEKSSYFPNVPTLYEEYKIPEERGWPLTTYLVLNKLRRFLIAPPGVPSERIAFLRRAVSECFRDKAFLAEAVKLKRPILPLSGEEMQEQINKKFGTLSDEQVKEFKYIAVEKYNQ